MTSAGTTKEVAAMIEAHDEYYGGVPAPLPAGVARADADR
jgi:hypothetical protein